MSRTLDTSTQPAILYNVPFTPNKEQKIMNWLGALIKRRSGNEKKGIINILIIGQKVPNDIRCQVERDERIGLVSVINPAALRAIHQIICLTDAKLIIDAIGLAIPWSISENLGCAYIDRLELLDPTGNISQTKWECALADVTLFQWDHFLDHRQHQVATDLLNLFRSETPSHTR